MKNLALCCKALLVMALVGAALSAGPAVADEIPGDLNGFDGLVSGPPSSGPIADTGSNLDDDDSIVDDSIVDQLIPEGPAGPVGFVDVPTYEAVRGPGGLIPTQVDVVVDDTDVDLLTFAPDDRSAFMALLVINSSEASTEYRFNNAVPSGHTATLQTDGSVRFVDAEGNEAGGIAAPWAVDANGEEVSTHYTLDGETLVQTVEHSGAAYPVIADPWWFVAAYVVVGSCMANPACANRVLIVIQHGPVAARLTYNAITAVPEPVPPPQNSPTNLCNMGVSFASGC